VVPAARCHIDDSIVSETFVPETTPSLTCCRWIAVSGLQARALPERELVLSPVLTLPGHPAGTGCRGTLPSAT
jgi:hypothetical protein